MLLGLGLRSFSMSPAFVPMIKKLATLITVTEAEQRRVVEVLGEAVRAESAIDKQPEKLAS